MLAVCRNDNALSDAVRIMLGLNWSDLVRLAAGTFAITGKVIRCIPDMTQRPDPNFCMMNSAFVEGIRGPIPTEAEYILKSVATCIKGACECVGTIMERDAHLNADMLVPRGHSRRSGRKLPHSPRCDVLLSLWVWRRSWAELPLPVAPKAAPSADTGQTSPGSTPKASQHHIYPKRASNGIVSRRK